MRLRDLQVLQWAAVAIGITMLVSFFPLYCMLLSRYSRCGDFLNDIALLWQATIGISLTGAGEF